MTAKKLTAEELAVKMEMGNHDWADDAATMLRQQDKEIKKLHKVANAQTEKMINLALELARAHRMIEKAREK